MSERTETPQHEHDCDTCVFLGRDGIYDLWFHDGGEHPVLTTVIARFGRDGDYLSGLSIAKAGTCQPLSEALRRATEVLLYPVEVAQ